MPNILDYLTWRGDVPFSVSPPNEVDNYIHCKIGTLDFTGIVPENELYVPLPQAVEAYFAAGGAEKLGALSSPFVTSYALMALLLALANALPENCRALAQTGKMSYQIMLLDPFYKVVLFAAAGKLFGGMPLALLPLIAAADFALGVITCMVIRKIPGVRILFGL